MTKRLEVYLSLLKVTMGPLMVVLLGVLALLGFIVLKYESVSVKVETKGATVAVEVQ